MANVKFGFNHIGKPTPALANKIFNYTLYTVGIVTLFFQLWPHAVSSEIQAIVMRNGASALAFIKGVSSMFGVEVKEETVPKEDVAVLKTDDPIKP